MANRPLIGSCVQENKRVYILCKLIKINMNSMIFYLFFSAFFHSLARQQQQQQQQQRRQRRQAESALPKIHRQHDEEEEQQQQQQQEVLLPQEQQRQEEQQRQGRQRVGVSPSHAAGKQQQPKQVWVSQLLWYEYAYDTRLNKYIPYSIHLECVPMSHAY